MFRDFVVRVRIQRAAELMRQPNVSVTEAAFGVGFNDLSYFARMFRRQWDFSLSLPHQARTTDYPPGTPPEGRHGRSRHDTECRRKKRKNPSNPLRNNISKSPFFART